MTEEENGSTGLSVFLGLRCQLRDSDHEGSGKELRNSRGPNVTGADTITIRDTNRRRWHRTPTWIPKGVHLNC